MTCFQFLKGFQFPANLYLFCIISFPSSVIPINVINAVLRKYKSFDHTCPSRSCHFYFLYSKGLQPLGTICGLLGTSCTAGGEQQANTWSFVCSYSHSPLPAVPPELRLLSDQRWHDILIGAQTLLGLAHAHKHLVPDDPRWSRSSDAGTMEQLQTQIINRSACTETVINQLLAAHIRTLSASGEWWWAVYFIIYHSVIIIEIKCTINVLESPQNRPSSPVHGKIVFPKTRPRCQKSRGPLLIQHTSVKGAYTLFSVPLYPYLLFCPARRQNCSCPGNQLGSIARVSFAMLSFSSSHNTPLVTGGHSPWKHVLAPRVPHPRGFLPASPASPSADPCHHSALLTVESLRPWAILSLNSKFWWS